MAAIRVIDRIRDQSDFAGTLQNGQLLQYDAASDKFVLVNYAGQTNITILGTISVGTWQANPIEILYGGTGATTAADARNNLGVPSKYVLTIGNGVSNSIRVTHGLGTQDIQVTVYTNMNPFDIVYPDIQITDINNINLIFGNPPSTNQYRVVVVG